MVEKSGYTQSSRTGNTASQYGGNELNIAIVPIHFRCKFCFKAKQDSSKT